MPYLFATEDHDFSDFAGGRVLYSQPGLPAFPVRLASEIFQRAVHRLGAGRLRLYDPVCGGAYHLAALGFLHGDAIASITASDADGQAAALAQRNLGLLSAEGLARRAGELEHMLAEFGKESHADALRSLAVLRQRLDAAPPIQTRVFQANALDGSALQRALAGEKVDLVISDIPYGLQTHWLLPQGSAGQGPGEPVSPLEQMLTALQPLLPRHGLVAVAADKNQKIRHAAYRRVERFQIGKRQVAFLQLE